MTRSDTLRGLATQGSTAYVHACFFRHHDPPVQLPTRPHRPTPASSPVRRRSSCGSTLMPGGGSSRRWTMPGKLA